MSLPYRDQARKSAPYALAYALGVASFWIASAIIGGTFGGFTTTTYESEGVSSSAAYQDPPPDRSDSQLPTTVVYAHVPSPADLREAAREGDLHSVRRLLSQNVAPDSADERGRTALMLAAGAGEAGIVATLISAGADTAVRSAEGETPLMAAAIRGDVETVRLLLRNDAEVFAKSKEGSTAHDLALRHKHDHVARLIADEIDRINRERILVTRAQFLLAKLGFNPGGIDGKLGPRTRDAIIRFQRDQELELDGRVTNGLLAALDRRQKAVEEIRRANRTARAAERQKSASEAAFRRASAPAAEGGGRDGSGRSEAGGGGFFDRAGQWLERNLVPDADPSADQPDS